MLCGEAHVIKAPPAICSFAHLAFASCYMSPTSQTAIHSGLSQVSFVVLQVEQLVLRNQDLSNKVKLMQQEALESRRIELEMARRNSILQNTLQTIVRRLAICLLCSTVVPVFESENRSIDSMHQCIIRFEITIKVLGNRMLKFYRII